MPKRATKSRSRLGVLATKVLISSAALLSVCGLVVPSIASADPTVVSATDSVQAANTASAGSASTPDKSSGPSIQPVDWCQRGQQWCNSPGPGYGRGRGMGPGQGFYPGRGYYGAWRGGAGDWRSLGPIPYWGAQRVHIHFWWNNQEFWDGWWDQINNCWEPWQDW